MRSVPYFFFIFCCFVCYQRCADTAQRGETSPFAACAAAHSATSAKGTTGETSEAATKAAATMIGGSTGKTGDGEPLFGGVPTMGASACRKPDARS